MGAPELIAEPATPSAAEKITLAALIHLEILRVEVNVRFTTRKQGGSEMAVMVGIRMAVDPESFMDLVASKGEDMKAISEQGRSRGAVHHMFLAGDGEVMVADEWDSVESFQAFWTEMGPRIGPLMAEAGVAGEPQPTFWRPPDTPDRF